MALAKQLVKWTVALYLAICVAVHIYGLFTHFNNESNLSHIVHTLSYGACLLAWLYPAGFRLLLYAAGAVYPVIYHALCLQLTYAQQQTINGICLSVVVILPLAGIWLWWHSKQST